MTPFITVAVCTRNRADSLRLLLDSLTRLIVPPALTWELLVIDNASTDHTAAVIDEFLNRLPLRREVEPESGLSVARNRATATATGDYLIWTDDDARADPAWLAAYAAAFRRHPDAALFAGRIEPILAEPVTDWFHKTLPMLAWLVAARDFGDIELPLSVAEDRLPFGVNAAIRAAEQCRFRYDTSLGVNGAARMVGEEVAVFRALLAAGGQGWWVPDAKIFHHIPASRQSTAYVSAYFAGHGASDAHCKITTGASSRPAILLYYLPRLVFNFLAFHLFRNILPPRLWVRRLIYLGTAAGAVGYAASPAGLPPPRTASPPYDAGFDSMDRDG